MVTAVILAGGVGVRLLPITRSIPKSLVPVGDKPALQHVLEELTCAGISKLVIISNRGEPSIRSYFNLGDDLCRSMDRNGQGRELERTREELARFEIHFVDQPGPLGGGNALLLAEEHVGNQPFVVILPDDLIWPVEAGVSDALQNLAGGCEHTLIFVREVQKVEIPEFDTAETSEEPTTRRLKVRKLHHKSAGANAPPIWGLVGRYIFTPAVFDALRETPVSRSHELLIADAVSKLIDGGEVFAHVIKGRHYDIGSAQRLFCANVDWWARHGSPELRRNACALLTGPI